MRQARIRGEGLSDDHCLSRVVDRQFILGDEEREHFVLSNHFHLLVEEPDRSTLPPLDRETLLRRLGYLYGRSTIDEVSEELDRAAASTNGT